MICLFRESLQETRNVGVIRTAKKTAVFSVQKSKKRSMIVFSPIFDSFPLQTIKVLDFFDFKQAVTIALMKNNNGYSQILKLNNGMNSKRTNFNSYINHSISINSFWLLGFFEGEGSFGYKNSIPYLQIAQNKKSERVLYAIMDFMKTIPLGFSQTKNVISPIGHLCNK